MNHFDAKKVLITGAHSYIGESFEAYAKEHYPDNFKMDTIDMIDGTWKEASFRGYDAVFHVAGIAHADVGNVSEETRQTYYRVNTDLAQAAAQKAKDEGVGQFVLMSSMIVYGESAGYGRKKKITMDTKPEPANFYGDSKWQADQKVRALEDESFRVTVLRPPMIYGKGSKGNYPVLANLAKKLPVFPDVTNERSMLHIDNLCEFLCKVMLLGRGGIFFPQNGEYTRTSDMVEEIAKVSGKPMKKLKILNPAVFLGSKMPGKVGRLVNKAFGNMTYDQEMSIYPGMEYRVVDLKTSIARTEGTCREDAKRQGTGREAGPRALMLASVASMIDLFNEDNIHILINMGYEVDVATNFLSGSITSQERVNEYKKELEERGIGTYQVPIPRSLFKVGGILTSYRMVKKLARERRYEIVHCHSPIGGVICRLACRDARKKYGTKVIYTAHGFHFFQGASKKAWALFYPAEKFCSRFTDVLITINQEDYERAKKFHAKKVEYVPGIGVHTEAFQKRAGDPKTKRYELGFSEEDFIFMSTGQLSHRKNQELVIRALAKIPDPRVKYLIVGFGELEDYLRSLVGELHLEERVVFVGYRRDVKELLWAVDGYVFPSLQEGLPVALMEAMSAGLPVVCTHIRGNTDLIEHGKGGFLYDCRDENGFAEGMRQIASGQGKDMGKVNLETMKKFDVATVCKKMEALYTESRGMA